MAVSLLVGMSSAATAVAADDACPWVGSGDPPAAKAAAVVSQMTLTEKFGLLTSPNVSGWQNVTTPVPRLCIPSYIFNDGPSGIIAGPADSKTQLPVTLAVGASFDRSLAYRYGALKGEEARTKGIDLVQGPIVDIARVPQSGREGEGYGEDPYLSGEMGANDILGTRSAGANSILKHFTVYNQETNRNTGRDDAQVTNRVLHEIYLPEFEAALKSQPASVMCSYATLNGTKVCQNSYLMNDVLRGELGFQGFVRTDLGAVPNSGSATDAGAANIASSFNSGVDLIKQLNQTAFMNALSSGQLSQARVDEAVKRILTSMFQEGVFDRPRTGTATTPASTPEHVATARDVAEKGAVLLKNDGILPLNRSTVSSIAVIGNGTSQITGSGGVSGNPVTPFQGIRDAAGPGVNVTFDDGTNPTQAAAAAAAANRAVLVVTKPAGEGRDVTDLSLPNDQDALVNAVTQANPNTIVVITSGNPVLMPWIDQPKAVLEMWFGGQEIGNALAALLFGDANPSGKLPMTFPQTETGTPTGTPEQWPGVDGKVQYSEGLGVGYRGYDVKGLTPLFPFGYGLSYTTFAFSNLTLSSPSTSTGSVTASATVTNTGGRAGAEVAQLYVGYPTSLGEPPRQLRGFEKVNLNAGESKTVTFTLTPRDLSYWDSGSKSWVLARGNYSVMVGDSSRDLPLTQPLAVTTTQTTTVGGTVPATLSLALGTPASFGAFTPGLDRTYDSSLAATVTSTAGDATLSVTDPSSTATGRLVNGSFALDEPLQTRVGTNAFQPLSATAGSPVNLFSYAGPVSNDAITVGLRQHVGSTQALRTGAYSKALTFTLSTTTP